MSEEVIYKFYDLESLTQEKLNELARERNTLAEENKQLKEELEKKNKKYWQQQCAYYSSILYSLEEWLKKQNIPSFELILDKIQELRKKYE